MTLLKSNERLDDLKFNNLFIIQNPNLYCFTSDSVLLANFAKAKQTDKVVDLCSGSGIVGILMQAKTKASYVYLVEIQNELADMSKRSIIYNNLQDKFCVINKTLQNIHKEIGTGFDVVVCNPPYKQAGGNKLSQNQSINICKHEITVTLEEIVLEASKLLKFGGYFYIINKEERLTDLICYLRKYNLEPKQIEIAKGNDGNSRVLVKAKKGGKSGVKITFSPQN